MRSEVLSLPTTTDDPALPRGLNPAKIARDLNETGVSAPTELVPSLQKRVEAAKTHGIDLKIVYYPGVDGHFTMPRNLAELLKEDVPGTILVLNDKQVGSYSPNIPRYALERSEHNIDLVAGAPDLYAAQPVVQVDTFIRDVAAQPKDWSPFIGAGLVSLILVAAVIATVMRRKLDQLTQHKN